MKIITNLLNNFLNNFLANPLTYLFEKLSRLSGQPANLYVLFFTEMWERYGFYTNRAILTLYMTQKLLLSNDHAYAIFGAFASLLYLTPTLGGFIADRLLGFRVAIILGALLLALGYGLLAIPGMDCFYYGLSAVILGNGFFKPNVSACVGDLYTANDPRRHGGFSIFYAGINIGGMLPSLVVGLVILLFGWPGAFLMATVGVLLGLVVFLSGMRNDKTIGVRPKLNCSARKTFFYYFCLAIGAVLAFAGMTFLVEHTFIANFALFIFGGLFVGYSLTRSFFLPKAERNKLLLCHILILFSILFWVLYQQAAMSLTIFTEFNTDRHILGGTIPTTMFQSCNPFTIILFAPLLSWLWVKLSKKNLNPSVPAKFALGTLLMGIGFVLLPWIIHHANIQGQISFWWIIASYFFQSIGELLLSPVGLSMVTELSPPRMIGLMMGAWFFATAVANALAGYVSELTTIPSGSNNPLLTNAQYAHVFGWLGGLAVGAGVLALVLTPALKKLLSPAPAQTNKRVIKTAKTLKITLRKDRILEVG